MHAYWEDRLSSVPLMLTDEEASAMTTWVTHLDASIAEGVALTIRRQAALRNHSDVLRTLNSRQLATNHPAAIASLLGHLLTGTQPPFYDCHDLAESVRQLRTQPAVIDLTTIVEQALRLGCADSPPW